MELKIFEINQQKIAEINSEEIVINDVQEALDLMADAGYYEARCIILSEMNLKPEFFELRTGMAGELLQKFSQYNVKLAIIGEFEKYQSKSLKAFIVESNRGNQIFFVPDRDTATARLSG
jgi:hypothetical protein